MKTVKRIPYGLTDFEKIRKKTIFMWTKPVL